MTDRTVFACPECDTASVHHNNLVDSGRDYEREVSGDEWRCHECGATFNDGVEREAKQPGDTPRGLARRLADADPDEVGT